MIRWACDRNLARWTGSGAGVMSPRERRVAGAARQRAQQNLPKSLPLYWREPLAASRIVLPGRSARRSILRGTQSRCSDHLDDHGDPRSDMTDLPLDPPLLVLDTNVVLDWLYFSDPACSLLSGVIRDRQVRWIASPAMRDEIEHVLRRGIHAQRSADAASVLSVWDMWASMRPAIDEPSPAAMRCTDPDDQKFIDLALRSGASALLTRDRAVLKLAQRARAHGLRIETAIAWQQRWTARDRP